MAEHSDRRRTKTLDASPATVPVPRSRAGRSALRSSCHTTCTTGVTSVGLGADWLNMAAPIGLADDRVTLGASSLRPPGHAHRVVGHDTGVYFVTGNAPYAEARPYAGRLTNARRASAAAALDSEDGGLSELWRGQPGPRSFLPGLCDAAH